MDRIPLLTDRELEVFRLMAEGPTNIEIAESLFITERTVRAHTASILGKLRLESRLKASMAAFAFTRNLGCGCGDATPPPMSRRTEYTVPRLSVPAMAG